MARAEHILVNANKITKDTKAINEFINEHLFNNPLIKNENLLKKEAYEMEIDERYDYRPDKLAYEVYGEDFYYPFILAANNLGSMLQFKAEILNYKCLVPRAEVARSLIGSGEYNGVNISKSNIIENIFKDVERSTDKFISKIKE